MTLTKELLDRLLDDAERGAPRAIAPGGDSPTLRLSAGAAPDERRQNSRVALAARVMIVRLNRGNPQPPVEVELRDVSTHGACIVHSEAFAAGEQFALRLPREDATTQWIHCIVVEPRSDGEGRFCMGCKFTRIIEPARRSA